MSYGQPTKAQIEYARGHFCIKRKPPYPDPVRRPLSVLSEREKAMVAEKRAMVLMHLPEAEQFIKDLYEAGMIDGWRSVVMVDVHPST